MKIILFDGECNLCDKTVTFIIKHDRKAQFHFASLQSEIGRLLCRQSGIPTEEIHTAVYLRDDRYLLQSTALLHILKDLRSGWQIFYIFIIIPPFIRNAIYRLIAQTRYRIWGKKTSCSLLNHSIRERFL